MPGLGMIGVSAVDGGNPYADSDPQGRVLCCLQKDFVLHAREIRHQSDTNVPGLPIQDWASGLRLLASNRAQQLQGEGFGIRGKICNLGWDWESARHLHESESLEELLVTHPFSQGSRNPGTNFNSASSVEFR